MLVSLKKFFMIGTLLFAAGLLPRSATAWTSVSPIDADINITLATDGTAMVHTAIRLEVRGGLFHAVELGPLPGASLLASECRARGDDGVVYNLEANQKEDGRTTLALAGKTSISRGGITFEIAHQIDLIEQDSLRLYEGRARLDFTPLVWDWGFERMTLRIELPGASTDAPIVVDPATTADYEVKRERSAVTLTKFRAVRWYPMRAIASFDRNLVARLAIGAPAGGLHKDDPLLAAAPIDQGRGQSLPFGQTALVFAVVLMGLLALWRKAHHVHLSYAQVGMVARFAALPQTGIGLRAALSTTAALAAVVVQLTCSVAAGIPAVAVAALLVLTARTADLRQLRPGGSWRALGKTEESRYRMLSRAYRASRASMVDITTARGAISFVFFLGKLAAVAYLLRGQVGRLTWIVTVDGLLLGVLAWFSNVRSELPHDVLLEAFPLLDKWRKTARKLAGKDVSELILWVREDAEGPIEVRLRLPGRADGMRGIEVAGESVFAGTIQRIRPAFVARFDAGAAKARTLAASAFASEHHLTSDCAEEVVVLRTRRGKDGSLAALRTALAL